MADVSCSNRQKHAQLHTHNLKAEQVPRTSQAVPVPSSPSSEIAPPWAPSHRGQVQAPPPPTEVRGYVSPIGKDKEVGTGESWGSRATAAQPACIRRQESPRPRGPLIPVPPRAKNHPACTVHPAAPPCAPEPHRAGGPHPHRSPRRPQAVYLFHTRHCLGAPVSSRPPPDN